MTDDVKRKQGRPMKRKPPEPIPDTAQNALKSLLKTRPKGERKMLQKRGDDAAS
ncbi:MAG: hypothetical protein OXK21_03850 [Chloroflexota bacterium]|nr:hypothetical protein [Chloroflexota bacterium]